MDGTTSGLRIKSDISRGGNVDGVRYQNVCLRDVKVPIDISTHYNPRAEGKLVPRYTGISFEHVHSVTPGRVLVRGYDPQHLAQLRLQDVSIAGKPDWQIEHATLQGDAIRSGNGNDATGCSSRFAAFPGAPQNPARPQLTLEQAKRFSYSEVLKYTGAAGKETVDPCPERRGRQGRRPGWPRGARRHRHDRHHARHSPLLQQDEQRADADRN